jgi:hypothetical protein
MDSDMEEKHHCIMESEWATLHAWLESHDEKHKSDADNVLKTFHNHIANQNSINANQQELISKLMHRIYGNENLGINTEIKLNRQTAESEIKRVEEGIQRLWWAFGAVAVSLIGNLIKNLLF